MGLFGSKRREPPVLDFTRLAGRAQEKEDGRILARLDSVFPWFWPSVFKAGFPEDNPFIGFLEEIRKQPTTIERRRRYGWTVTIFCLAFIALNSVLWNSGVRTQGLLYFSGMALLTLPLAVMVRILLTLATETPGALKALGDAPFTTEQVLWGMFVKSGVNASDRDDPRQIRSEYLSAPLFITAVNLILLVVLWVFPSNANYIGGWTATLSLMPAIFWYRTVGLLSSVADGELWSPAFLVVPLASILVSTIYSCTLMGVYNPSLPLVSAWLAGVALFNWIAFWLIERIPYWEIQRKLKAWDTNQ